MPFVEVKQSGPDIPDGVYAVILTAINGDPENPNEPRHVVPTQGPNINKDLYFWDWVFALDIPGHALDGTPIEYGTSHASGSKSNMYKLLTALLNGISPAVGTSFEKTDLIGRRALATIQRDQAGYCRITNLGAMPASMQQAAFAGATGAPVQPVQAAQPAPQPQPMPIQQIVPPQPQQQQPVVGGFGQAGPQAPAPQPQAAQPLREQVAPAAEMPRGDLPF